MKKKYEKPLIAVESFQLDAAIAGACAENGAKPLGYSMTTCTFEYSGDFLFAASNVNCIIPFDPTGAECYQPSSTVLGEGLTFLAS